ncbi:hypothetical protein CC2G_001306 [Coprinopsis cinerea AmutBmut pab1-1]|nr:hypothetical protein CC2G_001306 [Coprinopsis cinerea AmutBmut pab1-1]
MAATSGLPPSFLASLKQMASSEEGVVCFLEGLDPHWIYKTSIESILNDLQTLPPPFHRSLELTLSYGFWAEYITDWLDRSFPSDPRPAFASTVHAVVLTRLVNFIYFEVLFQVPDIGEQSVLKDRLFVLNALQALDELSSMDFKDAVQPSQNGVKPSSRKKSVSQAERKRQQRREREKDQDADDSVFQALDMVKPTCPDDADVLALKLVFKLKEVLVKYLDILQTQKVATAVRTSLVRALSDVQAVNAKPKPDLAKIKTEMGPVWNNITSPTSAISFAQPLKAALYFDSAFGFGQWEIMLSSRGISDLKAAYKRNRKLFNIVMKKIKELSNAHFSDDNQKRLNRGEGVPVFEAKMTGDTRLVYQIDCIAEYDVETKDHVERQVIRIFGIYTHTQLDRLWDSLGYQLSQKGREYIRRCGVRNKNRDGSLIVPAIFPPNPEAEVITDFVGPELPKEDLEEIHSLLVLEKFVTFSKELRNSILAELDVNHVFKLHPNEMEIIEHPFSCYVLGRSGTGKTTTMLFKMLGLERTFTTQIAHGESKPRQLFVTKSRVLASKVEEYFMKLMASLQAGSKSDDELRDLALQAQVEPTSPVDGGLYHQDDDVRWQLPKKYSLLQDEHFPLFLTFEKLAELIIADLVSNDAVPEALRQALHSLSSSKAVLSYSKFLIEYWIHFPQNLTKGLDPALVFSEIIGVIKGSEQALENEKRYLDKHAYLSLSDRTQYLFSSQRDTIYAIFMKYLQRKRELEDQDPADRTHKILEAFSLETVGVPGSKVDFLYIDEAQDNMLIDGMLLRSLCKAPTGLFWAGDTAQTISVGNSFRFEDLKAFMHRLEERRVKSLNQDRAVVPKPATFFLSTNYRSHGGIVSCAHSVIEIITHFWPSSLDKMAPEKGIVNGLKPFFFGGTNSNAIKFEDFLTAGQPEGDIEFGARQCILVRDDEAKKALRQLVGNIGIIMTLYDSKGLEFDDVLLYQFFEDSTVDFGRWRVLASLLPGETAPQFDPTRHAGLCSELKSLYVAITRARKKLWIYDNSTKAEPLRNLWTSKGLIENFEPGQGARALPRFAVTSSRKEWKDAAKKFFKNKNFAESIHAFKRAGMDREAEIAQAYLLRKEAETLTVPQKRRKAFLDAGRAFEDHAHKAPNPDQRRVFLHNAAGCFENAGDYPKAAEIYRNAEEYDDALRLYRKAGMFDEGVQVIKGRAECMNNVLVEEFKDDAKLFYFKDQAIEKAKDLFETTEDTLEYFEENPFLDESRALFLADLGRNKEAAQIHLEEGRLLDAIRLLVLNTDDVESLTQGHEIILKALWRLLPFGTMVDPGALDDEFSQIDELLFYASTLETMRLHLPHSSMDQITMFQAIWKSDWSRLLPLGKHFLGHGDIASAILCLSHYFHPAHLPDLKDLDNTDICHFLSDFLSFCGLFRTLVERIPPLTETTQQLFGIQDSEGGNRHFVPSNTWLGRQVLQSAEVPDAARSREGVLVGSQELTSYLRDSLLRYLAETIRYEDMQCRLVSSFTPCAEFALAGHCRPDDRCRKQHMNPANLTKEWLQMQTRIHLQQILILQVLYWIPYRLGGSTRGRRFWINRFYHSCNPPSHIMGSWSSVDFRAIPEAEDGLRALKNWSRTLLYGRPDPNRQNVELTFVYQAADLCFRLDRRFAGRYVHRSPLVNRFLRYQTIFKRRSSEGRWIFTISELLSSLDASRPNFITAGILAAKHIVDKKAFIDLNVLCNFLEFLSGAIVVARSNFEWHNVTLPRSLCGTLLQRMRRALPPCDIRKVGILEFLDCAYVLLRTLVEGGEHAVYLLHGTSNAQSVAVRSQFIPRVCRAMGLVAYNLDNLTIYRMVLERLEPLKKIEFPARTYSLFAHAKLWTDVFYAVESSTRYSPFDDMIHLWSKASPPPKSVLPNHITRVFFESVEELRHCLAGIEPRRVAVYDGTSAAVSDPSTKPDDPRLDEAVKTVDASNTESTPTAVESFEAVHTGADMEGDDQDLDEEIPEDLLDAGLKIMKACRMLIRRRECETRMASQQLALRDFFRACLQQSEKIEWPPSSEYRLYYLGVVPHLLVCLQWALQFFHAEKTKAKKAFKEAKHTELQKTREKLNTIA